MNIHRTPRFLFFCLARKNRAKWSGFLRRCGSGSPAKVVRVSSVYKTRVLAQKQRRTFFCLKGSQLSLCMKVRLDFVLFESRFFCTLRAARRAIRLGSIFVGQHKKVFPGYVVTPGVLVHYPALYLPYLETSKFFSLKEQSVVIAKLPYHLEVSYSSRSLVFCFLNRELYLIVNNIRYEFLNSCSLLYSFFA